MMVDAHSSDKSKALLIGMTVAMSMIYAVWYVLLNNFVIERAGFNGEQIGMLHSIREIPGFLAFTVVLALMVLQEQRLAILSLVVLTLGVGLTGFFPSEYGLYAVTVLMSVGFHYFEATRTSLSLQWLPKKQAPAFLGKMYSYGHMTSLVVYGLVWLLLEFMEVDYKWIYLSMATLTLVLILGLGSYFPRFKTDIVQHKHLFMRRRYWLFYLLTFMGGARRQIFMVFASFLLVEKFDYAVKDIALLYMVNTLLSVYFAPKIGALIGRIGERRALGYEYSGLVCVFVGYAFVDNALVAAGLFLLDHLLFAMAIGIKTYFQKIADPKDIAGTSSVSFSINHIAAVIIPALFGILWLFSPALVFILGAVMAGISWILSRMIPNDPAQGQETIAFLMRKRA